jgi:hypothetical protein
MDEFPSSSGYIPSNSTLDTDTTNVFVYSVPSDLQYGKMEMKADGTMVIRFTTNSSFAYEFNATFYDSGNCDTSAWRDQIERERKALLEMSFGWSQIECDRE